MKQHDIITVNGQSYDTVTGLPVAKAQSTPKPAPVKKTAQTSPAHSLHAATQRSTTLRRATAPKPQPTVPKGTKMVSDIQPRRRPGTHSLDVARHPQVGRMPQNVHNQDTPKSAAKTHANTDTGPRQHPHVVQAERHLAGKKQTVSTVTPQSSKATKEAEISKALATAVTPKADDKPHKKRSKKTRTRTMRLTAIVASVVIIVIIAVWVNLPTLSVAFASAQSGVNADFPHFTPDGYSLKLPVDAQSNRVTMTFSSNQNATSFSLSQEKSAWDSQAVRALVEEQSKGQFLTTQDRGLTVYTYDGNAAWVNKGILYKLSGDSRLSNDTIMRIASSL